jgi:hypothetical protein
MMKIYTDSMVVLWAEQVIRSHITGVGVFPGPFRQQWAIPLTFTMIISTFLCFENAMRWPVDRAFFYAVEKWRNYIQE